MRRLFVLAAFVTAFAAALAAPRAAGAQERTLRISSFDAEYVVSNDGSLTVTERITAEFHGKWNGLYRAIPVRYDMQNGTEYTVAFAMISASDEGGNILRTEEEREGAYVKIKAWIPGAEDATHTLVLKYSVGNALRFFDEHDELYWNVTGDMWEFPIDSVTARIVLPAGATGLRATAFTGVTGSRGTDVMIDTAAMTFRTTRQLGLREGLTIVQGWDPNPAVVKRPTAAAKATHAVSSNAVMLLPLIVLAIMSYLWRRFGKDPDIGTVVTQYEPPPGLSPAEAGTMLDLTVDQRDIAATLVDLAVRGHIRISEITKEELFGLMKSQDYMLERLSDRAEWSKLKPHEEKMLDGLFPSSRDLVEVSELKNVFYTTVGEMKSDLNAAMTTAEHFRSDPNMIRGLFLFGAIASYFAFAYLTARVGTRFGISATSSNVASAISALIIFIIGYNMPARTLRGTQVLRHVLGFQEFLGRVEGERMKRVIDKPELFEKYLPYAIAFNVDDQWAKAFEGMNMTPPTWYTGTNGGAFHTRMFVNDIGRMSAVSGSAMTSAPRSSSGSGFSGGSSGGSSGGGFGGGGGGGF